MITLALVMMAHILRMVRSAMIDVMASDFVQMARLRACPSGASSAARVAPAMLPTINIIALTVAWLLGGAVIIEQVFNYPGIGTLMIRAIYDRDLPLVQAIALILATVYVLQPARRPVVTGAEPAPANRPWRNLMTAITMDRNTQVADRRPLASGLEQPASLALRHDRAGAC